ncbi:hypothetical protein JW930_02315 [Candidatus Woesearchaeota archaeon]|nr:hypothetical protein [Candidatus Woesearchaeota archaeon]
MIEDSVDLQIVELYNRDITALYSINQISKKLKKAYPYINKRANRLISKGILKKVTIGRSYLCSINLKSDSARAYLMLNEIKNKNTLYKKNKLLSKIGYEITKLIAEFKVYSVYYADDSIIFLLDHIHDNEAIKRKCSILTQFNPIFFEIKDFEEEVLQNKKLIKDKIVLYGYEKFFEVLSTVEEQLKIKYVLMQ